MRSRPVAESLLALVVTLLAGCTVQLGEGQLLHPWPMSMRTFADDIDRRNVDISAADGVHLRGWLLDVPDERFTLVFFYGNGQSVVSAVADLYTLADVLRADVLCVDYRGYGFSDGSPTFALLAQDALRVFDHAAGRAGGKPVVVMGYSLGTGSAVLIAAQRRTGAVVLVAPPASPGSTIDHLEAMLPWYARIFFDLEPTRALRRLDPTPEEAVRRVTEPLLVVHGTADRVVPFADGRRMFDRAASRAKRFCPISGQDHGLGLFAVPTYRSCVVEFLAPIGAAGLTGAASR